MEESTQRRERLKAMRMEASQENVTCISNVSSAVSLSNPFLESTTDSQTTSQSFNYYTNPMAAYSGNKKRSQVTNPQDYSSPPPRSPVQPHVDQPPNPQMQQQSQRHNANSNYAYASNPPQNSNFPISPHPRGYSGPGGVGFPSPQTHFCGSGSSPHFTNNTSQGYPSPGPNFRNSPNHGSGQVGYPISGPSQGRGYGLGFNKNMTSGPSFVRGRGPRQGGGRGSVHNYVSAEDRPDRFFNRSMVEDPWKFLEPVIWKPLKKQWMAHSINAKKPRVSESRRQSSAQPSLAEILAASFNEAVDDDEE